MSSRQSPISNPRDPRFLALLVALAIVLASACESQSIAWAADAPKDSAEVKVSRASSNEAYDRGVDEVALASQQKAIDKLGSLLKKYRGSRQEPILLARLGDIQQQAASILFRIAHASAPKGKAASAQSRYPKAIQQTIRTYSELIAKYPNYEEIPHAFFARGKSYEDLGDKENAAHDYLHLVKNFAVTEESLSAYMSLAEFSIQANDHARAVTYLKEVEKHEDSPHFPFALYKLAWAYYNLKNVPASLSYAERQIAFYNARSSKDAASASDITSDSALKENTLLDIAVFYFEGYEQKQDAYSLAAALPYFKKIESGPILGKILLRFGKLLRSHDHEADLFHWKNAILASESDRPESIEVLITAFEFELLRRDNPKILELTQDFVRLYPKSKAWDSMPRAQKLVLDTAEGLQQSIIKNKDASEIRKYSETLAKIYDSFTRIVEEADPRIPRVHYNLAETLFVIKDYAGATDHYRWIVTHWKTKNAKDTTVADAGLKAIACRYEVLRERKQIPTELKAVAPGKESQKALDPPLAEWIEWIDIQMKGARGDKTSENFVFESSRALYGQGYVERAVQRMRDLIQKNPKSPYAVPAASLILDTAIASEDWEKVHELATSLRKMPDLAKKDDAFSKRLYAVAADSFYKQIEQKSRANDPRAVMNLTEKFVELYSDSKRFSDAMILAGSAAQATASPNKAIVYFTNIINGAKGDSGEHALENLAGALASRAQLYEDQYILDRASVDYKALLGLPQDKLPEKLKLTPSRADDLRRKTLALSWITGSPSALRALLKDPKHCASALAADCEKYEALLALGSAERALDSDAVKAAFDKSRKEATGTKDLRALWAAVALEGSKSLTFRDRNNALKILSKGWDALDPLVRFTLIPRINASIPKAFELNRQAMKEVAPLRADEKYITHRVDVIKEMENAATAVVKLPWARVRAQVLNEVAGLYIDLARGLRDLSPPKGLNESELSAYNETIQKLVLPFEEKGQDVRSKAFEIASRFSVEDEVFNRIAEPYFAENPSTAKKLKLSVPIPESKLFDLSSLEQLDPKGDWGFLHRTKPSEPDERVGRLKMLWARAIREKQWHQVGFYLQESQEKALISSGTMGLIKAISLASVGARGEGVAELEQSRKDLGPSASYSTANQLLQFALRSYSRNRVAALLKELEDEQAKYKESPSRQQAFLQNTAKTYLQ